MTTDNRTTLNACDANTSWTGDDGTPTAVTEAGLYYENGTSLSFQHSNADEHTYTTAVTGSPVDLSDATVFLIVKVNQQNTQANGGMKYVLGDGTDRIGIETNGADNPGVQLSNLFYGMSLDVTNRTAFTQHVFAGVAANLTVTAITVAGYGSLHLAKAQGAVDNVYLDRLSWIANDSPAITINGGTSGTPETWSDVAGDDSTNGWGVCGNPVASQFQINCPFAIGTTAAADSYFTMSNVQLYLLGQTYAATHFFWELLANAGQTHQLVIDGSQVISVAGATGVPCDLNWNNSNFDNIQVDGSLFVGIGNLTLPVDSATRWIRTTTFDSPTRITPNTFEMTDCVLAAGSNTNANGMVLLDTAGDSDNMSGISFISDGTGHAIEISAAGTYDFNNITFTSYGADGTTDAAVYISVNAAVTINVLGGGDTPTVRNSGTAPTINNSVTVTVDGVAEGTACKVVANETAGTVTVGDTLGEGLADSTGAFSFSLNYEGAFGAGLDVIARARNQGLANAAIADDNGVFTDQTGQSNSATAADMNLLPATPVVNQDSYIFGHHEQFSGLKINVSTAGTGGFTITWQYWNGAWTNLSGVTDDTSSFSVSGTNYVTWTLPGDWATTTINSQGPFYFVRARYTAGTVTVTPLGRSVTLDVTRYLPFQQNRTITAAGLTVTVPQAVDRIAQF